MGRKKKVIELPKQLQKELDKGLEESANKRDMYTAREKRKEAEKEGEVIEVMEVMNQLRGKPKQEEKVTLSKTLCVVLSVGTVLFILNILRVVM